MKYNVNIIICFLICLIFLSCSKSEDYLFDDAMDLGQKLNIPTPNPEKYFDDLIHPCVRYVEGGFQGHDWWMVATPYRGNDASMENPILFYGDSREGGLPPLEWTSSAIVEDTPSQGYNSDGALLAKDGKLWVFWRENHTLDCYSHNYHRATFGRVTSDGISFSDKKIFAGEITTTQDSELCPIVISRENDIYLYGANYTFKPKRRPSGIAIWGLEGNDLDNHEFVKKETGNLETPKGFKFWHFDLFSHSGFYYCVATPERADAIFLGMSQDGVNYKFWSTPLLTSKGTGRSYFYKPSALVKDNIFYLWHPVAEEGITPRTSRIWMSQMNFNQLIELLTKNENLLN